MRRARSARSVASFFAYARERHSVYLRRAAGEPREKWTRDPILQKYRFTNVFRELDKTTAWFRKHVRDPMRDRPEVLLATVVFRLLNRIPVGEAIFCQKDLEADSAFELFVRTGKSAHLKRAILALLPRGPFVTGAYIISSPPGLSKLDGVMQILQNFHRSSEWERAAGGMLSVRGGPWTLQQAHAWLSAQPWLGNFHAYEVATDLRWTALLDRAPDVMSWASAGPGARRGLNRVMGRDVRDRSLSDEDMLEEMRDVLWRANHGNQRGKPPWPVDWPAWEMREVEHTLCEFDKYERVRLGEGRPRGVFR